MAIEHLAPMTVHMAHVTTHVMSTHYAHDRPATVHYVVHCLGRYLWTMFTNTVHGHCSKKKNDPRKLGRHTYSH